MTAFVALLRGVNVGGGNKVPMADLRDLCAGLGWTGVRTYIASGNLVFAAKGDPATLAEDLRRAMVARMGVDVPIMVLPGAALHQVLDDCPIAPAAGNQLHGAFLWADPHFDDALYAQLRTPTEEIRLQGRVAWVHTPDGFGRSKLAEKLPKVLGVDFTARNLNTIRKLVEMLDG
ncbi:DUF1697 domain-containing protein [Marivivens marinus]|uniref:DUF1697 domain-containing protein n=1 Tax=Marivivens marinus TaxID=3110173 RepID=UPI003B8457FA